HQAAWSYSNKAGDQAATEDVQGATAFNKIGIGRVDGGDARRAAGDYDLAHETSLRGIQIDATCPGSAMTCSLCFADENVPEKRRPSCMSIFIVNAIVESRGLFDWGPA